jgi:hypothetical protein
MSFFPGKGLLVLSLLTLGGCTGSSDTMQMGGKSAPLFSLNGKVIDGYVSGATVWLDINGNGELDTFEPSAVSSAAGSYSLELTEQQRSCVNYASLIVDVPVGAIDEDTGPVTEAYQMVRPPRLEGVIPLADADIFTITPLTTVLADYLQADLNAVNNQPLSCDDLKNNATLRQQVKDKLLDALANTVRRYNLSTETIFSDYIDNNDQQTHTLALSIVKGLKAGYAYKAQLEAAYPDAVFSRVEFAQYKHFEPDVQPDFKYRDNWFRQVSVWLTSGFISEMVRMNDELSQELAVYSRRNVTSEPWGNGQLRSQWTGVEWDHNNQGSYLCSLVESVSIQQEETRYTLSNSGAEAFADTLDDCQPDSFSNGVERNFGVDYTENGVSFDSRFTVSLDDPSYTALADWVDLRGKAQQLQFSEMIAVFSALPYKFEDPVAEGLYTYWYKRRTDDTGDYRLLEYKGVINNEMQWYREVYQADGTYIKQCTINGISWESCEN